MTYETDPQPLVIEGVDAELRFHPLPALNAVDEFLGLGTSLDKTGALDLLMVSGTGMRFDPSSWDIADAALLLKALVTATGASEDNPPSAVLLGVCTRYGVQLHQGDAWVKLDSTGGMQTCSAQTCCC